MDECISICVRNKIKIEQYNIQKSSTKDVCTEWFISYLHLLKSRRSRHEYIDFINLLAIIVSYNN